jgi:chitin disaccharide deacetylase
MKPLVVVADDFGLCASVNEGCAEAYQHGMVTELSLMLGSPGTGHALELVRKYNLENVGVHVLLKHWREHGDIFRRAEYIELFEHASEDELSDLLETELAEFEQVVGRPPTHITSQYGIISNPKLLRVAVRYAREHNLPMRLPVQAIFQDEPHMEAEDAQYLREQGVATTDHFFGCVFGEFNEVKQRLLELCRDVGDGQSVEIMLHPGYMSDELQQLSSVAVERERDVLLATDKSLRRQLKHMGFAPSPYRAILQPA